MNTQSIPNMHAVEVKYLPATNTQGSRVKLTSYRLNESKTIPYDYARNDIAQMAIDYLNAHENTHDIIAQAETKNGTTLIIAPQDHTFQSIA